MVYCVAARGTVGVPEMAPVLAFRDKPWGRKLAENVCGVVPFVLGVLANGAPAVIESLK